MANKLYLALVNALEIMDSKTYTVVGTIKLIYHSFLLINKNYETKNESKIILCKYSSVFFPNRSMCKFQKNVKNNVLRFSTLG